jgi:hypothetical protein
MTPIIFGKNILRYDAAKLVPTGAQPADKPTQKSPAPDWRTGRRDISENHVERRLGKSYYRLLSKW